MHAVRCSLRSTWAAQRDHAAGVLIVEEAGGKVVDFRGNTLDFSAGRRLENNVGIVCTNRYVIRYGLLRAVLLTE